LLGNLGLREKRGILMFADVQEVIQNLEKVQRRTEWKYNSTAGNKAFVIIRHSEMTRKMQ
jgi:hypothetical protein